MQVEAKRTKEGFLIPLDDIFKDIKNNKVLLEVEVVKPFHKDDYSALDQIVGLCETKQTDASINHDKIIYGLKKNNDLY
ncbi:MAG: hypothetical protein U9R17_03500 [Thermodesulfobacteriota bacterium]|nr:hypothetical protein [Thermodesulfobacteriota bacterium]